MQCGLRDDVSLQYAFQASGTKQVRTRMGKETMVRNLTLEDEDETIEVALWQDCTSLDVQQGQRLLLKDVTVNVNQMTHVHQVSVNDSDDIEVCVAKMGRNRLISIAACLS